MKECIKNNCYISDLKKGFRKIKKQDNIKCVLFLGIGVIFLISIIVLIIIKRRRNYCCDQDFYDDIDFDNSNENGKISYSYTDDDDFEK